MAVTNKAAAHKAAPPLDVTDKAAPPLDVTDKAAPPLDVTDKAAPPLDVTDKAAANLRPLQNNGKHHLHCTPPPWQFSATLHHWSPSSSAAHNRSRASRHSRASSDCSHVASFCCRVERGCPLRAFRSWKRGNAAKLPRGSVTPQISHLQCTSKNQSSKTSSWGTTSQTPYKHQNV